MAPVELGLPTPKRKDMAGAPRSTRTFGREDGRVLALAARSHEAAGEEWLPQGVGLGANQMHGVFTFHLAQALRASPTANLTGLARAIRGAYASERRTTPTPEFRGNMASSLN